MLLALAPAFASAGDLDAAMHCVRATMTSAFVPATTSAEQLANVAIARCGDEIEVAAVSIAGTPVAQARIEASRVAVRRELHVYALEVAGGGSASAASPADASRTNSW